ncbi:MAG: aspartate kinase [Legionellales bacterium]|nr:aspartate kinase [Legionellales bacterium]
MSIYVRKFGGSSLANLDRISHVADIITKYYHKGHKQVIVVSAMFGETDRLVDFAREFDYYNNSREYAVLVSTGEQVAMSLLCMALNDKGVFSKSFNGSQALIKTDSNHLSANITGINAVNLKKCLLDNKIAVVAGFQGIDTNGDITTLGRGGSDTTAVALSSILKAKECLIYTDVDGVYSADPRIVPNAQKITSIDHSEMLVLSHLGAKVMQPRSIELAAKYNMTIKVLSSFHSEGGTCIQDTKRFPMESPVVRAITCLREMVKVSLKISHEYSSRVSELLNACYIKGLKLEMLRIKYPNSESQELILECVVSGEELEIFRDIVAFNISDKLIVDSVTLENKSILSAVGIGLQGHNYANVLNILVSCLEKNDIKIFSICTGDIRVSLLIDDLDTDIALRLAHQTLGLD